MRLGAEFAAAWSRPPTEGGPPFLVQLKRAALGLFVKQKPLARPGSDQKELVVPPTQVVNG